MLHRRRRKIRQYARELFENLMVHEPTSDPTTTAEKSIKAAVVYFQVEDQLLGPEEEDSPHPDYLTDDYDE